MQQEGLLQHKGLSSFLNKVEILHKGGCRNKKMPVHGSVADSEDNFLETLLYKR